MSKILSIGVFDSGIGGLSVLHACALKLPCARYYYYGDNDFAPYGSKTKEEICTRVASALGMFSTLGVDAAVLACNTATALCIDEMRARFSFPIVGVEPAVLPAAKVCRRALVLATPRTIESVRLHALIERADGCDFTLYAAENLAGAIERRIVSGEPLNLEEHLPVGAFDGVVLGCTHYVHVSEQISTFYHAPVFDGCEGVASRLTALFLRDETPLFGTSDHFWGNARIKNECSFFDQNRTKYGIYFLGKTQNINKNAYKRLFISHFESNLGFL